MRIPWLPVGRRQQAAYAAWELKSVPDREIDIAGLFARKMRFPFSVLYDFSKMKIHMIMPEEQSGFFMSMARSSAGLKFARTGSLFEEVGPEAWCCVGFPSERESQTNDPFSSGVPRGRAEAAPILSEFFGSFRKKDCRLLVSFIPARMEELDRERASYEKRLSKEHSKGTERGSQHPNIAFGTSQFSTSASRFVCEGTDETQLASEIVSMCNNAKNLNDSVFRVSVAGWGGDSHNLKSHLLPKLLCIEEEIDRKGGIERCIPQEKPLGEIMSGRYASKFISFSSECAEESVVVPLPPLPSHSLKEGVPLGHELVCGVDDCGREIGFDYRSLNRHCSITGQQGTGKTTLAISLALPVLRDGKPVVVITPSGEWSRLAGASEKILVVDVASAPMNPVRCPEGVPVDVFYQNLALQMSNAMHAGPYTIPLRRTLLRAFRELYAESREPTLEEASLGIEDAVRDAYGSGRGYAKFDKYGQNLSASLENLRELMQNGNFNGNGILIEDCVARGAVFDLSGVSKLLRPLVYSFLLTQLFSYAGQKFDEQGENDFRLLLVLEEAHLVFKKQWGDDGSREVVEELENELGAFRKKGIGLMFITHYSDQLSEGIWRHAQNHFVFKQDSIGARLSIDQLAFDRSYRISAAAAQAKISKLGLGECCCLLTDRSRRAIGPFFMHVEPDEPALPEKCMVEHRLSGYMKTVKAQSQPDHEGRMTDVEEMLLSDIHAHRFSGITSRYKRLGFHPEKGTRAKDGLVAKGIAEECPITVDRKNFIFLVPTAKGIEALGRKGAAGLEFWTAANESFKHKLFQNAVKESLIAEGWDAIVEQPRPKGGFVDVAAYGKDRTSSMAVEITLRPDNVVENVRKDLEAGFAEVRIVCEQEKVEEKCYSELKEVFPERLSGEIVFRPIGCYKEHISD